MSFDDCKVCPLFVPTCPDCGPGKTCILVAQSCKVCAYVSCLDNAQVSAGHYTIGSTGIVGPISTINPIGSTTDSVSSASASTTISPSSLVAQTTATAATPRTTISTTGISGTGVSVSPTSILSSVSSQLSSQLSSAASSIASTPTPGAAATTRYNGVEMQAAAWVLMAFWIGMSLLGGRQLRL